MLQQRGYSLLEILLVISILGVVAAVAIPNFSATDPGKLDLAADEIAEAMRFARSEATRTGSPRGFQQDSSQKRIRVFRPDMSATPWTPVYDVYHPVSKKLYDIQLDAHPFASADGISHSRIYRGTCNQSGSVYFDSNGTPWCADPETVLLQQFDVTLSLGPFSRVVTLHGVTGRVTIQ